MCAPLNLDVGLGVGMDLCLEGTEAALSNLNGVEPADFSGFRVLGTKECAQ
jgi:hypothetical protein